ncbi:MAG: hypothetical protein ACHQQS_03315 [Thermoanaerobaculales bacterium]
MLAVAIASLGAVAISFTAVAQDLASPTPLVLAAIGSPRVLPDRLLGANAEPWYNDLVTDPTKKAILAGMHLGFTRFPGGSLANYYDWKRGLILITGYPNSSAYTNYWVGLAAWCDAKFPTGVFIEQYKPFSDALGAEVVMVPNLETASVSDQVAWFAQLAAEGIVPTHIEMGNEFWVAMGGDPNVEAHWPDEPTTMAITQQYADGFRPYLPANAKVAVQAAPGAIWIGPSPKGAFWDRLRHWNDDLHPEPWFDAVTTHLYPRLEDATGDPNANHEAVTPALALRNFEALMGVHDDCANATLTDLESRVPGKEIWITEWNGRSGGDWQSGKTHPITPAIVLHTVTRMLLTCLQHPSVTMSLYFQLNFLNNLQTAFVPGGSGYAPLPATEVFGWFCQAANGGATWQQLVEPGATRLPGNGAQPWTYAGIEGALFRGASGMTVIVQNATPDARSTDLTQLASGVLPSKVETISGPDLTVTPLLAAVVTSVTPSLDVTLPPYSVTRLTWPASPHRIRRHLAE